MADEVIKIKAILEDQVSNKLNGIKAGITAAFGALTLGMIANTTIKLVALASAAEETKNKFDVIFGKSGKITQGLDSLAKKTGFAASTLQEMVASLAALIKPAGFSADKTFELSKRIAQLSLDLGSFMNLQPQDIVRDFQSALAGSSETLQKYGIDARETTLAQKAFNMGLIDSKQSYEKLDPEAKRHVRTLALIEKSYDDTKSAQGDLARTSDSYANKLREFGESVKILGENLGKLLMPALTDIVNVANNGVKWIKNFIETITKSDIEKQIDQMRDYGVAIEDVNKAVQQKTLYELGKQLIEAEKKLSDAVKTTNEYFAKKIAGLKITNMDYDTYIKLQEESEALKSRIIERSKKEFEIMMAQHKAGVESTEMTTDWSEALIEQKEVIDNLLATFDKYAYLEEEIDNITLGAIESKKTETGTIIENDKVNKEANKTIREKIKLSKEWREWEKQLKKEIEEKTKFEWGEDGSPEEAIKKDEERSNARIELAKREAKTLAEIEQQKARDYQEAFAIMMDNLRAWGEESQTAFELYKAYASAETMISAFKSAQKIFEAVAGQVWLGPLALPAAAAASGIAMAAGMARASAIASQDYKGKAIGGDVVANQPYIVGERGREMFVPNMDGYIIPNNVLKKLGGKSTVININAIDAQSFKSFLRNGGASVLESEMAKGRLF